MLVHLHVFFIAVPEIDGVPSFAINSSTGEITVNSASLDRENISSYSLIVKVGVIYVIPTYCSYNMIFRQLKQVTLP